MRRLLFFSEEEKAVIEEINRKLYETLRTGYVDRGVKNPETVGQHTDEMILMAKTLFNIHGLEEIVKIHDWAESDKNVGDPRTDPKCPEERRWTKKQKHIAETAAMNKICSKLPKTGGTIMMLWLEYEAQKTRRAKIAKQLDRIQTILKAAEYEKYGHAGIASEFIEHYSPEIKDRSLKRILLQTKHDLGID